MSTVNVLNAYRSHLSRACPLNASRTTITGEVHVLGCFDASEKVIFDLKAIVIQLASKADKDMKGRRQVKACSHLRPEGG